MLFAGSVQFLGETRAVPIYLTGSDDSLIGTSLPADCRLLVDFPAASVRLTRNRLAEANERRRSGTAQRFQFLTAFCVAA